MSHLWPQLWFDGCSLQSFPHGNDGVRSWQTSRQLGLELRCRLNPPLWKIICEAVRDSWGWMQGGALCLISAPQNILVPLRFFLSALLFLIHPCPLSTIFHTDIYPPVQTLMPAHRHPSRYLLLWNISSFCYKISKEKVEHLGRNTRTSAVYVTPRDKFPFQIPILCKPGEQRKLCEGITAEIPSNLWDFWNSKA